MYNNHSRYQPSGVNVRFQRQVANRLAHLGVHLRQHSRDDRRRQPLEVGWIFLRGAPPGSNLIIMAYGYNLTNSV